MLLSSSQTQKMEYIEKHGLIQLFEIISQSLFYYRPEDPRAFVIEQLQAIINLRGSADSNKKLPSLYTDHDIETLFSLFAKNSENVTAAQVKSACEAVGLHNYKTLGTPTISKEAFIEYIRERTKERDSQYI
ncbi:MAG: hypothetical protein EZS28_040241 [Streblomastix strix]|uniref:Uncharacterized protein n=1 Tax=Streblomastix strix TaxID=222440 RepID=A0A5J4U2J9_9EUKA|nr:MAG: hypothetical protein EZS28_040241 [Streblomastix strix]